MKCVSSRPHLCRASPPAAPLEEVEVAEADGTATVIAAVDVIASAATVIGIAATASAGIGATEVTAVGDAPGFACCAAVEMLLRRVAGEARAG